MGRIVFDALSPWSEHTLNVSPKKLISADGVNHLLAAHGDSQILNGAKVKSVSTLPEFKIASSNCQLFVIQIEWDSIGIEQGLPNRLFLKLPCQELTTKAFCNFIDVWKLECTFLKNFSHDCPVRIPKTYANAQHRSRFILLEEDLNSDPSVQLFTNANITAGPPLPIVKAALSTFARLHAFYHGLARQQQEQRLSFSTHPYLSPVMAVLNQSINNRAVAPCRNKAGSIFSAAHAELFQRAMANWERLLESWYAGPLTLIHGDSHLGNVFQYDADVGMIDFQAAQWGKGVRDVQYFLINSVPEPVLAEYEKEWLQFYLDELQANGVKLSFAESWEQYRGFSFQTLMTMVVSIGLGPLTEKDTVMETMLERAVAAIDRLEFSTWLDQQLI